MKLEKKNIEQEKKK